MDFYRKINSKIREILSKFVSGETSKHLIKTYFVYGFIALSLIIIKVLIARLFGQEELGIFTYFFSVVRFSINIIEKQNYNDN